MFSPRHFWDGKTDMENSTQETNMTDQNPTTALGDGEPIAEKIPGTHPNSATLTNRRKATLSIAPPMTRLESGAREGVDDEAKKGRVMTLRRMTLSFSSMLKPERQIEDPTLRESLWAIVRCSYLNVMLVFIPVSWALHFALPETMANRDTLIFVFSFLAIIPLAKLLGWATEELSLRVGQTLAGLMNATLGNAVELIVAIIALIKCELRIVQSSLVGSVLSNLLLVLGMCFFAGGLKYQEQGFGAGAVQLNSSLLTLSVIAILLPAAFHFAAGAQISDDQEGRDILAVSRGTSIILLVVYVGYLLFQLYSHAQMFQDDSPDVAPSTEFAFRKKRREEKERKAAAKSSEQSPQMITSSHMHSEPTHLDDTGAVTTSREHTFGTTASPGLNASLHGSPHVLAKPTKDIESTSSESEAEKPAMTALVAIGLLLVVTALVGVTAEFLVTSINGLTQSGTISEEFVGIILLPIVGNAAEHVTAVTVSVKDKLNLSLSVAAGSSIQIALFVIPLIVTLGWILDKPMTLLFDPYESIVLFFSVLVVNYVVQDGKSNWLEGFLLMMLYLILAVTFWFYPAFDASGLFSLCH
ncbi:hypothetical protein D9756_003366 [Leucocoprinus leucothites]|uniref:Sodium/calcium exchanger membrane region domain-containing protein n=1 Tax=Leucocoprinus leucothites TaxID=201217 RepID=A0A8H5G7H1_9AGAR|nr:hypothetical protein D9756_003366 [Leucoagaricus leucothites]